MTRPRRARARTIRSGSANRRTDRGGSFVRPQGRRPGRRARGSGPRRRPAGSPDSTRSPRPSPTRRSALASQPAAGAISPCPRYSTAIQKALRAARPTSAGTDRRRWYDRRESSMLSAYLPRRYVAIARRSRSSGARGASAIGGRQQVVGIRPRLSVERLPAALQGGGWRGRALRHRSSLRHQPDIRRVGQVAVYDLRSGRRG